MNRKLIAIVPAAGVGARAGAAIPKQYQHIKDQPMLRIAVRALLADSRVDQVRVAVAPGDQRAQVALDGLPRTVWRQCGGATRADTVFAAVNDAQQELALDDEDWVMVHDAARPGLPQNALARLIDACLESGQGGLLALRVADTVKREAADHKQQDPEPCANAEPSTTVTSSGARDAAMAAAGSASAVHTSVPRDRLWLAQTPQMFPVGVLKDALNAALRCGADITDEASAVEMTGAAPLLVQGSMRNFKVTWPEDAALMERWLD